jgi:hypothetical protein
VVDDITVMLDYNLLSPSLRVYWLLPMKSMCDDLRIVSSDDGTSVMK